MQNDRQVFLETFNNFPEMVRIGLENIDRGITRIYTLMDNTDDEAELEELNKLLGQATMRKDFVERMGRKMQRELKMFQHHCLTVEIPSDAPEIEAKD